MTAAILAATSFRPICRKSSEHRCAGDGVNENTGGVRWLRAVNNQGRLCPQRTEDDTALYSSCKIGQVNNEGKKDSRASMLD